MKIEKELLTKKEVATVLGISTRTIDRIRARGVDVGAVRLGPKTVRFKASRVKQLLEDGIKFEDN